MNRRTWPGLMLMLCLFAGMERSRGTELFDTTTPYHHIRVIEEGHMRTLCFDDATQTRLSTDDPLKGHFEYTEYFHMAWLWNTNLQKVLMVGLGGGSAQRAFVHYYPATSVETVEIDPAVERVARGFFSFTPSDRQQVHIADGRMFLRRSTAKYDLVILDAYVHGRYGSSIPQHLVTREFFEMVRDHLNPNGLVAYNVIGSTTGWHADIVGAIYRTLRTTFSQVYVFPARSSQNVVLIATRTASRTDLNTLRQRAAVFVQTHKPALPTFRERVESLYLSAPANADRSPVLTDDYAPVEGLTGAGG